MKTDELIKYLQDIVNLETQKRIAGNTYNRLTVLEKENAFVYDTKLDKQDKTAGIEGRINWIGLVVGMMVGLLAAAFVGMFLQWTVVFLLMSVGIEIGSDEIEVICFLIALLVIEYIIIMNAIRPARQQVIDDEIKTVRYQEDLKRGRIILQEVQEEKPKLKTVYFQCDENLKKLYSLNIVHPNYQYLEACGMFLQYLERGRTHSLVQAGGDMGAYNLYEQDLKFEVIKRKLDQVLKNQEVLYHVLTEINNNVEDLSASVQRIEGYSRQTAKNTKISKWCDMATAINTHAMKRMMEEYVKYN